MSWKFKSSRWCDAMKEELDSIRTVDEPKSTLRAQAWLSNRLVWNRFNFAHKQAELVRLRFAAMTGTWLSSMRSSFNLGSHYWYTKLMHAMSSLAWARLPLLHNKLSSGSWWMVHLGLFTLPTSIDTMNTKSLVEVPLRDIIVNCKLDQDSQFRYHTV